MDTIRRYKIGTIVREDMGTSRPNWATHIDMARRNHKTLRGAKNHIDNVLRGEIDDGLWVRGQHQLATIVTAP